jgi:hypothetical protein
MIRIKKHLPILAALSVAACTDSEPTLAPSGAPRVAAAAMPSVVAREAVEAQQVDVPASISNHATFALGYPSGAQTYQFEVDPAKDKSFIIGAHLVQFPKNTICDPAKSNYGPGTWLSTCTKLKAKTTITAITWTDAAGRPQIDFANALRFVVNSAGSLPAIYLRDPSAAMSWWARIDYCDAGGSCVDESTSDPTLATQRDAASGFLFRLIRHFSGYNVWA